MAFVGEHESFGLPGTPFEVIPKAEQRAKHWLLSPPCKMYVCDGLAAVADREVRKAIEADGSKNLWTGENIEADNDLLKAAHCTVRLIRSKASELLGHWPHWPDEEPPYPEKGVDGKPEQPNKLYPVAPVFAGKASPLLLPSDCGKAACEILGIVGGQPATQILLKTGETIPVLATGSTSDAMGYLITFLMMPESTYKSLHTSGQKERRTIYRSAYAKYMKLGDDARSKMDQKYGLNEHALPAVGEAFVCVNMNDANFLDDMSSTVGASSYPHHWGAVILHRGRGSGSRRNVQITLEILHGDPASSWFFGMYGNKGLKDGKLRGIGAETFHAYWKHRQFKPHCLTAVFRAAPASA